jgi:putative membrane protein
MAKFDHTTGEQLAHVVQEIESKTAAEIVIVVRARSAFYRHADYLCGAILAMAGLVFVLFSPFDFHTYWVPVDVTLLFVLGAFVCSRTVWLRRLLTGAKFRAKAARQGAAAMFYEAGIANTHAENGLLIYLALVERQVEVIADRGILKAVPPLKWNEALFELQKVGRQPDPDTFMAALRHLGALLAEHYPATEENPNELPDMPSMEL